MHIDDAHDDNLVAKERALHAHARAQTRAADAAMVLDDLIILITSSDDQTEKSIDEIAPPLPRAKIAPLPPHAFATTTDEIALSDDLAHHNEPAIARTCIRHSVEFVLPSYYRPDVRGEMRVIGVDTKKLTKTKAVLIVIF